MKKVMKKLSVLLVAMLLVFNLSALSFAELEEEALPSPVIYGDFNGWAIEGEDAYPLEDAGEGLYKAIYYFDAYDGEGDGYTLLVCVTKVDYGEYGWGAGEQYTIDGELAGFGAVSIFNPEVSGKYQITFNSETKETTVELHEVALPLPVIYGDFNGWAIEGEDAYPLEDAGEGIFKAVYHFDAYDGEGDGYTLLVCVTKINYGEWGWRAGEQYTIEGELAGFGAVSIFNPEVSGKYQITFNSETKETTIELHEVALPLPVIYGDFNGWVIEGEEAYPLEDAGEGIFKAVYHFDAYGGEGDGYTLLVCVTKINYGEWGWGAGEQYTIEGELAGFGAVSIFNPEKSGNYEIIYNSETKQTTISYIEETTVTEPGDLSGFNLMTLLVFLSLAGLGLIVSIKMPKKNLN